MQRSDPVDLFPGSLERKVVMVLILKNIEIEGPGLIGHFLVKSGYHTKILELSLGDEFPEDLKDIEAVLALGGPMNVYEEDKYSFLSREDLFIKQVLKEEVPFLGICLGAQLLAKANGATVKKASRSEVGFFEVNLTEDGRKDPIFRGMKKNLSVFQWHEDTFDLPRGASLLATSNSGKGQMNQAFRVGNNAYGLQFHLEVDDVMVLDWIREYLDSSDEDMKKKGEKILDDCDRSRDDLRANSDTICYNFSELITPEKD